MRYLLRTSSRRATALACLTTLALGAAVDPGPAGAVPLPDVRARLSANLAELVGPTLSFAQDARARDLVRAAALRQFDGDTNVLLTDVLAEALATGVAVPADLAAAVTGFPPVGGQVYHPQLYIPDLDDGVVLATQVILVVQPADKAARSVPGYQIDPTGQVRTLDTPVDEAYAQTHEVWALTINEGPDTGAAAVTAAPGTLTPPGTLTLAGAVTPAGATVAVTCTPNGARYNGGQEYLQRFRLSSLDWLEWTDGKVEMTLIVRTAAGAQVSRADFGKVKRRHVRNWVNVDRPILIWDRARWGDRLTYEWWERDGSSRLDTPGGSALVEFTDSTLREYNTGLVLFNTCSTGGSPDPTDNLARSADTGASSTFLDYSPARVNDGSRDTRVGGGFSWANAAGTWPPGQPEWVELDLNTTRRVSRVVIYTTAEYPIRDFSIRVTRSVLLPRWEEIPATTNPPTTGGEVRGNTAAVIVLTFEPRTVRKLRLYGLAGPVDQPGFVRVNEFEVYQV